MINCAELVGLLFAFEEGELHPEHHGRVERHLEQCASCLAYLESYRLTVRLTRRLPSRPLPEGLVARLRAILESSPGA